MSIRFYIYVNQASLNDHGYLCDAFSKVPAGTVFLCGVSSSSLSVIPFMDYSPSIWLLCAQNTIQISQLRYHYSILGVSKEDRHVNRNRSMVSWGLPTILSFQGKINRSIHNHRRTWNFTEDKEKSLRFSNPARIGGCLHCGMRITACRFSIVWMHCVHLNSAYIEGFSIHVLNPDPPIRLRSELIS